MSKVVGGIGKTAGILGEKSESHKRGEGHSQCGELGSVNPKSTGKIHV